MKGRRRARRCALQALYELDQSEHDLDKVLSYRLDEMYHAAGSGSLSADEWLLTRSVIERWPSGDFDDEQAVLLAESEGVAGSLVGHSTDFVRKWVPHVRFCEDIVRGVWCHRAELDEAIARIAPEWPVNQMAPVDRNVLRMALWEIASETTPQRVAISEAVELARTFSGDGARRMVNGALGTYAQSSTHKVSLTNGAPDSGG